MVIWIWFCFLSKYHSFTQLKLTKLAYIGCFSGQKHLKDFLILFRDAMCSIRSWIGLKFQTVIPKSLWGAKQKDFPTGSFLWFFRFSFSCIWPWCEWVCLTQMEWYHLEFSVKLTKDHFFGIIMYYCWWHLVVLKEKWQCLSGFTFLLHYTQAWSTKVGCKNLCTPVGSPRHCSGK